jgi:putative YhdH/YhfP family quinone oxidoreductase
VIREYPLVPGIDLSGIVANSTDSRFRVGDPVLAHGYDIGVSRDGGYAQIARLPADWVVPLTAPAPGNPALTTAEAAAIGTAGFTAAMSIAALERHGLTAADGPILVTGASGGVGSCAVDILTAVGFDVVASTGKPDSEALLKELGAAEVIPRLPTEGRTVGKEHWAGAIDCVGGTTLAEIIRTLKYGGAVAASGITGGRDLPTSVIPFILRGLTLFGMDSGQMTIDRRRDLWVRLATDLRPRHLDAITTSIGPGDLAPTLDAVRAGAATGRALLRMG